MEHYTRYVTPGFKHFDPVLLAEETRRIVCKGDKRKYTGFVLDPEYQGIVTGYTSGCNLRCVFCGADWSRDYPEKCGRFYSPKEVFEKLLDMGEKVGAKRVRISGAEPTIGKAHLLKLLEYVENSEFQIFVIETNGILLGTDRDFVEAMSRFRKVLVRVSLKAGTPNNFARRTGAVPRSFHVPFEAIRSLTRCKIRFNLGAVTDPRLMCRRERSILLRRLEGIDPNLLAKVQEEMLFPYQTTLARLKKAGFGWHKFLLPSPIMKIYQKMSNNKVFDYRCL